MKGAKSLKRKKSTLKRRDNKGRVLRDGESQRQDGRYAFVYTIKGKQKFVYSWKLEETDSLPAGCRPCEALRTKEKDIKNKTDIGIEPNGGKYTVVKLLEKYCNQKTDVKKQTRARYNSVVNAIRKDPLGKKRIDKVTMSDAKEWCIRLRTEGKAYGTVRNYKDVISPAFQMAVEDNLLLTNPFNFKLSKIISKDSKRKKSLSVKEQMLYKDFIAKDKHYSRYYEEILFLFETGFRISEFCGLTKYDFDFEERKIVIGHQLLYNKKDGYYINEPKTENGKRIFPMTDTVYALSKRLVEKRKQCKMEPAFRGPSGRLYTGFLFLNKNGLPEHASRWDSRFKGISNKFNNQNRDIYLNVTPHTCRHTYCSNMARAGMKPKVLQYLMGHSSITTTLDIYTELEEEDAVAEVVRLMDMENLA